MIFVNFFKRLHIFFRFRNCGIFFKHLSETIKKQYLSMKFDSSVDFIFKYVQKLTFNFTDLICIFFEVNIILTCSKEIIHMSKNKISHTICFLILMV